MSEDLMHPLPKEWKRAIPEDINIINIHDAEEVAYWCAVLGISADELIQAVNGAGKLVSNVRKWIEDKRAMARTPSPNPSL